MSTVLYNPSDKQIKRAKLMSIELAATKNTILSESQQHFKEAWLYCLGDLGSKELR